MDKSWMKIIRRTKDPREFQFTTISGYIMASLTMLQMDRNFDPNCESMVLAIHTQLSSQHRNKQHKLHKYYKTFLTKEEALTHPPKRIKVSDWVNLCERFSSDDFQKVSIINTRNRSFNEVPPAIGTVSVARIVDMKRRQGEEVSAIDRYKIAHFSVKKNKMVNEKAEEILHDLQNEEATSSYTPAEICLKKLNRIPGHIKGRSTSMNKNLRMELELEKERTKDLEGKLRIIEEEQLQFQQEQVKVQEKQVKLQEEHSNMKEQMQMMMKELARLSKAKSKKRALKISRE